VSFPPPQTPLQPPAQDTCRTGSVCRHV
jgi:hypothetical protein